MLQLCIRTARQKAHLAVQRRCNSSTAKTAANLLNTNEQENVLEYLDRPLGVKERPTTATKSWGEKTLELMDQDFRLERRKHM